jgi:hypothetical protein
LITLRWLHGASPAKGSVQRLMNFDPRSKHAFRRGLLAFLLLVAAGASFLRASPGTLRLARAATPRESAFFYFAEHLGATELCEQISWSVYQSYSVMFAGGGGSYMRSDCFERAAELRHDLSICWKVRPLVDLSFVFPGYSAMSCRRRVKAGEHSATAIPHRQLVEMFERMGYDIDDMPTLTVFPPAVQARDEWIRLERNSTALAKARALVSSNAASGGAETAESNDIDYLADLVAHAGGDARICEQVRPDTIVMDGGWRLRDWCEFTVASNQGDVRLCQLLPPPESERATIDSITRGMRPEIARQLSMRGKCEHQASTITPQRPPRYGATVPPDDGQIRRIVTLLGQPFQSARAWSVDEQAAYFQNVLFALEPRYSDAIHEAARTEFVRRLLALRQDE